MFNFVWRVLCLNKFINEEFDFKVSSGQRGYLKLIWIVAVLYNWVWYWNFSDMLSLNKFHKPLYRMLLTNLPVCRIGSKFDDRLHSHTGFGLNGFGKTDGRIIDNFRKHAVQFGRENGGKWLGSDLNICSWVGFVMSYE